MLSIRKFGSVAIKPPRDEPVRVHLVDPLTTPDEKVVANGGGHQHGYHVLNQMHFIFVFSRNSAQ